MVPLSLSICVRHATSQDLRPAKNNSSKVPMFILDQLKCLVSSLNFLIPSYFSKVSGRDYRSALPSRAILSFVFIFQAFSTPEIRRVPLETLILQMMVMGLPDVKCFPFIEPPEEKSLDEAIERLLVRLFSLCP